MWVIELNVLNQSGETLAAHFSNLATGTGGLLALDYELTRVGGCGVLNAKVPRALPTGHSVTNGNLVEVYVRNSSESRTRRYKGVVVSVVEDYDSDVLEFRAWGLWDAFNWSVICKYYEGAAVDDIVSDIFDDIKAETYCNTTASISVASPATIGDVEINFDTAADVMRKLAEVQGSVDYGVDADGVFYFRDSVTTQRAIFQLGRNMSGLKKTTRSDDLYNDAFIKTRGIVSQGNLIMHEADATSVSAYKKRTKMLNAPELSDVDDAITWGENKVAAAKDPVTVYEFDAAVSTDTHLPYDGTVSLYDTSGTLLGSFSIEAITYEYSQGGGFQQKLRVGDTAASLDAGRLFTDIERKLQVIETSGFANDRIEHSGFDEFTQYVQQNALAAGKYNIWTHQFDETSGKASVLVKRVNVRKGFFSIYKPIFVSRVQQDGNIQTIEVPTGRELDAIRLYYRADLHGRYTFDNDDALEDWENFNNSPSDTPGYVISDAGKLIGNPDIAAASRGSLILKPVNWQMFNLGSTERAKWLQQDGDFIYFKITDLAGSTNDIPIKVIFATDTGASGTRTEFYAKITGADEVTFYLQSFDAFGVQENIDSSVQSIDDYIIRLSHSAAADTALAYIFSAADGSPVDSMAVIATHGVSDRFFYINTLRNSDYSGETGDAAIEWCDIYEGDAVIYFKVSRDGGTTWTTDTYNISDTSHAGPENYYVDLNISGQPAGDKTLIVKAELTWPARLYGIGMAWAGD